MCIYSVCRLTDFKRAENKRNQFILDRSYKRTAEVCKQYCHLPGKKIFTRNNQRTISYSFKLALGEAIRSLRCPRFSYDFSQILFWLLYTSIQIRQTGESLFQMPRRLPTTVIVGSCLRTELRRFVNFNNFSLASGTSKKFEIKWECFPGLVEKPWFFSKRFL